jgi:hypothetical protein
VPYLADTQMSDADLLVTSLADPAVAQAVGLPD